MSGKVDKVIGKQLSTEDYTTTEKNKLSGIANNANNYVHPANHPASIITQDSSNRFVSDTEKATWNGLPTASSTTTLTNKRITPRVFSSSTATSITPEVSSFDLFVYTALASNITINNHSSSTPNNGERMLFRFVDNGTPRNIYYGTNYVARAGVPLPLVTVANKMLTILFQWDTNQWNLLAVGQED